MNRHLHNRLNRPSALLFAGVMLIGAAPQPAVAQTATWTGGGAVANWTDGANWSPAGPPANGSTLEFSGTALTTSTNGIASGSFAGLQFTNDGSAGRTGQFTLSGSAITLNGNVTTTAAVAGALADTIGMAVALSGNRTFTTGAGHNLSLSGIVSGAGFAPVKDGAGSLTLSAANTFTGPLTVNSGTLVAQGNAAALGTGAATLALNDGTTLVLRADSNLNYGRNTTVSGTVTMIADRVTSAATATTGTLGTLSIGNANLQVSRGANITGNSTGQVDVGATTFTGPVTVAAGANASLRFTGTVTETVSSTLTIGSANAGTVTLTNSSATNSWTATVVNAGALRAFGGRSLGAPGSTTTVNSGATLDLANPNAATDRNLVFNGNARLGLITNGTFTFNTASMVQNSGTLTVYAERNSGSPNPIITTTNNLVLNGGLILEPNNVSGTTTLVMNGTITDNGTNLVRKTSTGFAEVRALRNKGLTEITRGFLRSGTNEALASGPGFGDFAMNTATGESSILQVNGFSQTLNGISTSGSGRNIIANDSNTNGRLTLGANDADGTFSGEMLDTSGIPGTSFTGKLSLVKTGTGRLTLSGPLSMRYTGTTHVAGGTLAVLTSQTSAAGAVTVASGATLSGTGVLRGATTIAGVLAPGTTAGSIGTLSFGNGLTWEGAAAGGAATDWLFSLGSTAGSADLASITGDFLKGTTAGSAFRFDFGGTGIEPGTYTLATWTGTTGFAAADFSYVNLANPEGGSFVIAGNSLQLTVVPEPGTTALLLGAGAAALILRRRSRRT